MDGILEELLTIEHENYMFFEELKFSIITESYTCLRETGTEMILEGVDFKKIKETVVQWIKNLIEKLKHVWGKVKDIFGQRLRQEKKIQKRLGTDKVHLKGGYDKRVLDIDFIQKTFTDAHRNIGDSVDDYANDIKNNIYAIDFNFICEKIEREFKQVEKINDLYTPNEQDAIYYIQPAEEYVDNYKKIVDNITNQYNSLQANCNKSIDIMNQAVKMYDHNYNVAKDAYDKENSKKFFDQDMKKKNAAYDAKRGFDKAAKIFTELTKVVKQQLTVLTAIFNTSISCANKSYNFAKSILNAKPQEG